MAGGGDAHDLGDEFAAGFGPLEVQAALDLVRRPEPAGPVIDAAAAERPVERSVFLAADPQRQRRGSGAPVFPPFGPILRLAQSPPPVRPDAVVQGWKETCITFERDYRSLNAAPAGRPPRFRGPAIFGKHRGDRGHVPVAQLDRAAVS